MLQLSCRRTTYFRTGLLVVNALLLLPTCRKSDRASGESAGPSGKLAERARTPAGPPIKKKPPAFSATGPTGKVVVKLIARGAEPRRKLRYSFKGGIEHKMALRFRTRLWVMAGHKGPPSFEAAFRLPIKTRTQTLADTGSTRLHFGLGTIELRKSATRVASIQARVRTSLRIVRRCTMAATISPRGILRDVSIKATGMTASYVQRMLLQLLLHAVEPFPAEPIGVGARWEVAVPLRVNTTRIVRSTTYELTALKGSIGTLKLSIKETTWPRKVSTKRVPVGDVTELIRTEAVESGTAGFDLSRPLPTTRTTGLSKTMNRSWMRKNADTIASEYKHTIVTKTETNLLPD